MKCLKIEFSFQTADDNSSNIHPLHVAPGITGIYACRAATPKVQGQPFVRNNAACGIPYLLSGCHFDRDQDTHEELEALMRERDFLL